MQVTPIANLANAPNAMLVGYSRLNGLEDVAKGTHTNSPFFTMVCFAVIVLTNGET